MQGTFRCVLLSGIIEWGAGGRRFKSSRPDQRNQGLTSNACEAFFFGFQNSATFRPLQYRERDGSSGYVGESAEHVPPAESAGEGFVAAQSFCETVGAAERLRFWALYRTDFTQVNSSHWLAT
jgi:hypothetical protein